MDTGLISRRYAKALAEYSASIGEESLVYEQLRPFAGQFDYLPQVREAVLSPSLPIEEKAAVIFGIFKGGPCRSLRDFVLLVLRHHRESCFFIMLHSFLALYRERHNIREAQLITAVPLGKEVEDIIRSKVRDVGHCTVNITDKVDPDIIGGFVFRMGDLLIDASIASQIKLLRKKLGMEPVRKI